MSDEQNSSSEKKLIAGFRQPKNTSYKVNSPATIDLIGEKMGSSKDYFENVGLASAEEDTNHVYLVPKGEKFYLTGNASGNFLTKEHPGHTVQERKENTQPPPTNSAKSVQIVESQKAQIGIKGQIKKQPAWAEESGYKARTGMEQIYTANKNKDGAIADGRYKVLKDRMPEQEDKEDAKMSDRDDFLNRIKANPSQENAPNAKPEKEKGTDPHEPREKGDERDHPTGPSHDR